MVSGGIIWVVHAAVQIVCNAVLGDSDDVHAIRLIKLTDPIRAQKGRKDWELESSAVYGDAGGIVRKQLQVVGLISVTGENTAIDNNTPGGGGIDRIGTNRKSNRPVVISGTGHNGVIDCQYAAAVIPNTIPAIKCRAAVDGRHCAGVEQCASIPPAAGLVGSTRNFTNRSVIIDRTGTVCGKIAVFNAINDPLVLQADLSAVDFDRHIL